MTPPPNIVLIENENLAEKFGTGFFISRNAIITCSHCVCSLDLGKEVTIQYNNSDKNFKISVKDENLDLALLKTEEECDVPLPVFTEEYTLGERVFANGFNINLGAPYKKLGLPLRQNGIIKDFDANYGHIVIENSTIFGGYSGSPLMNNNREVIGIIRLSDYENGQISSQAVAISAEKIKYFCERNCIIIEYKKSFLGICNNNLKLHLEKRIDSFEYFERNIQEVNGSKLSFEDFSKKVKENKLNIIYGIGGIGKSTLLSRLSLKLLSENPKSSFTLYCHCNVWDNETKIDNENNLEDYIGLFILGFRKEEPLSTRKVIETAKREDISKFIFVDGFNEIADPNTRRDLLNFLKRIHIKYNFIVCIATRNITLSKQAVWHLYETDGINSLKLTEILKKEFNKEEKDYSTKNFEFLKIPFFIDIAIKSRNDIIESYSDYINTHVFKGLENNISKIQSFLSEITFSAYQSDKKFLIAESNEINEKIKEFNIDILIKTEGGYKLEHHLVNEYFVAQYISKKTDLWNNDIFHLITFENRISFQVIQMILEQINTEMEGDEFLKKLYDWNFYAVLHCLKYVENKYTNQFARFLLLILSEKLFDNFQHSRVKVSKYLSPNNASLFEKFGITVLNKETIDILLKGCSKEIKTKILKEVIDQNKEYFPDGTFKNHFQLFSALEKDLTEEFINTILNEDSLIGWCSANVIRRANYSYCNELQLRSLYASSKNNIIHWRIVHALGKAETVESIDFLLDAIKRNEYIWATYGAIRSLIEIALFNETNDFSDHIFQQLFDVFENKKYEKYIIDEFGYCLQNKISSNKHKSVQLLFEKIQRSTKENFVNSADLWKESLMKFKDYNGIE